MQALALTQFEAVAECALDITGKAARQVIEGMILHVEGVDAVLEASFAESGSETDAQASAYVVSLAEAVGVDTQSPTFIEALSRRRSARNNAGRAAHGHKVLSIGAKHVQQLPYALASGAKSVMQRCELATHSRIHRLWSRYAPIKSTYESKMELREMASGADGGRGEFSWLAEAERALDAADADLKGKGSVDPDYDPDEKRLDFIPRQVVEEMLQRMITVASKRRVDHDEDDAVLAAARRERAKQGSLLETDADADKRASDANVPGFSLFSRCVRQGIPLATDRVVAFFSAPRRAVGRKSDATDPPGLCHAAVRRAGPCARVSTARRQCAAPAEARRTGRQDLVPRLAAPAAGPAAHPTRPAAPVGPVLSCCGRYLWQQPAPDGGRGDE